MNDPCGNF